MNEVKVINGIIKPGDLVLSMPGNEYDGLVGTITDIKPLSSSDRETENETDDIYVDFSGSDYSEKRQKEIEEHFAELYGEHRPFDELPLDMVIISPDDLIKITGITEVELNGLFYCREVAVVYWNYVFHNGQPDENKEVCRFIRVRFHHDDSGFCSTTFQTVDKKNRRYFNRSDCGTWYTVTPHDGYWENDSTVKKEIIFQIVDKKGNVLFTESNGFTKRAFSPVSIFLQDKANSFAKEHNLTGHEQWKDYMTAGPEYEAYIKEKNYWDNWLYCEVETVHEKTLEKFEYLDFKYEINEVKEKHKISGAEYHAYRIKQQGDNCGGYACGYRFQNGN